MAAPAAGGAPEGTMRSTAPAKGGDGGVASFVASTERNPFVLPSDEAVFQMREHERERRDALRESQAAQKLWERGDASNLAMTRKMISQIGALRWATRGRGRAAAARRARMRGRARPRPLPATARAGVDERALLQRRGAATRRLSTVAVNAVFVVKYGMRFLRAPRASTPPLTLIPPQPLSSTTSPLLRPAPASASSARR